ncbi:DnaJ-domain-containing protein, partial [Martensiomyces pterosporus]
MTITLPRAPSSFGSSGSNIAIHAPISEPGAAHIQAVGTRYASYLRRRQNNSTEAEDYEQHILPQELERAKLAESSGDSDTLVLDKVEPELMYLDPSRWKEQDHYLILGLSSLRYMATPAQIKKAYQLRALEFHPDKRAALKDSHDDTFFKCVQRAHEVLSDPTRRRQFDSVDPAIPDDIPKPRLEGSQDFFEVYGPVFEREARFSRRQPVPKLGSMDALREETEAFYRFWTAFDSWRSYEYLDKEKEQTENREEKRWQDKKNKAERTRLKKEDTKRVGALVSQAMALDPRIEMYKEQERLEKERKRAAKEAAAREAELERQLADEQRRQEEALQAEEERKQAAEEKRRRDLKKKEMRAGKKAVRE